MDSNGTSPVPQRAAQPSIRSFFQPRSPNYAPPPGSSPSTASKPQPPPPLVPKQQILQSSPLQPTPTNSNPPLPPQATISHISEQDIQPLRRINSLLLPIPYPDSFYASILIPSPHPSFSRIITWTDPSDPTTKIIGGIVCRLEPLPPPNTNTYEIYIQSLALLSPYRGRGLASAVLSSIISAATQQPDLRIADIYAHVWTENHEALEWYTKQSFTCDPQVMPGYYRKLKPDTAFLFRRKLLPSDHLKSNTEENKRPIIPPHARSFQERGPEREWNDLPEDVLLLKPGGVGNESVGSSRSSSRSRIGGGGKKKRERVYPAAAFGS